MYKIESSKDIKKLIRSICQLVFLLALLAFILNSLLSFSTYRSYDPKNKEIVSGEDHGFLALSYFGVAREGTETRIGVDRLEEHLQALSNMGYVTVTQKDIENYYKNGTPLPDKALFLMYEDGRHDTSVYSQKIMEKYNFKATMFTYAEKFRSKDTYFLMPEDLTKLEESSFWELGSNGYRLSYINVFDRYNRYIGKLSSEEYSAMHKYFGRNYDHFLMDYIRDENGVPMESFVEMQKRVSGEYDLMRDEYTKGLGKVPGAYILLHSNTGRFGENDKVSAVNEKRITNTFAMNFNREGFSINDRNSSIYDLTRLQPQASWYTNHLLMRIRDDLPDNEKDSIKFVVGDGDTENAWELIKGAAEYRNNDEIIALTSIPREMGILKLKDSEKNANVEISANLKGNVLGCQSVHLKADSGLETGVEVRLMNNHLYLVKGKEILEDIDLYDFDDVEKKSVDEDMRDSLSGEYAAFARYAVSRKESTEYSKLSKEASKVKVPTLADGAEEYRPTFQINDIGNRKLDIKLVGNKITVSLDEKVAFENYELDNLSDGAIYLKSAWTEYGYSQRNIADDVYDGVFEKVTVRNLDNKKVVYTNELSGSQRIIRKVERIFNSVVNWFITNI
ncbi:MAG: glycoside hydrolase [Butyrivibrio sp.]|nr:glycoside hydrolase [Butyrivibrio sp.]